MQFTEIGERGTFTVEDFLAARKPQGHIIYPPTTLVQIENTHNRAGGVIFPQEEAIQICSAAQEFDIASYLDGARLWNAAAASGRSPAELAGPFDLVSVAFSKGLGAPGGSLLAGSSDLITRVVRYRRMLGGAMRQVGFFAAASLYALDHNIERLSEDHENAKVIARRLAQSARIKVDLASVETNILVFDLGPEAPDAAAVVEKAGDHGVLIFAFGPRTIRAVTHLNVSSDQCKTAADILVGIVERQSS